MGLLKFLTHVFHIKPLLVRIQLGALKVLGALVALGQLLALKALKTLGAQEPPKVLSQQIQVSEYIAIYYITSIKSRKLLQK